MTIAGNIDTPQSQDRLNQAGAVAVRGDHDRPDRAANVVARDLHRHRQGQSPDAAKFRHAVHRSRFPRPAADNRHHRNELGRHLLPGRRTDGMAGVAHQHAGPANDARARHRVVRNAAVPRRHRLGMLAAPNSGLLNQRFASLQGKSDDYLFNIYSLPGLVFVISCYTFPLCSSGRERARQHCQATFRTPPQPRAASTWTTAPHGSGTAARCRPCSPAHLSAFLQAVTLFSLTTILAPLPADFHHPDDRELQPVPLFAKLELAAAASLPLFLVTVLLLQIQKGLCWSHSSYWLRRMQNRQGRPHQVRLKPLALGSACSQRSWSCSIQCSCLITDAWLMRHYCPVASTIQ